MPQVHIIGENLCMWTQDCNLLILAFSSDASFIFATPSCCSASLAFKLASAVCWNPTVSAVASLRPISLHAELLAGAQDHVRKGLLACLLHVKKPDLPSCSNILVLVLAQAALPIQSLIDLYLYPA